MWSFERGARRLAAAAALASALALSACIEPMYGPLSSNAGLAEDLKAIEVMPIPDRMGHYLRNELIFGFNGTGEDVPARYRLTVKIKERVQTPILDTVTGRATSATIISEADYALVSLPGEVELAKGRATAIAGYDRFSARFANVRAARDAEIRDAKVLAEDIRNRVAMAMAARR